MFALRSPRSLAWPLALLLATTIAAQPGSGAQDGVLIPLVGPRAHVFDGLRGLLYVSTASGTVERYDVGQGVFLTPFAVGGQPRGLDLSADGGSLYVCDSATRAGQGVVLRIDLASGQIVPLAFALDSGELGSWDIAVAANGKAVFSTTGNPLFLRELDLSTGTITRANFAGVVDRETRIVRTADRSRLFLMETASFPAQLLVYEAASGFYLRASTITGSSNAMISASPDGGLFALEIEPGGGVRILDRDLQLERELTLRAAGLQFDSVRERLYVADQNTGELVALDTQGFGELFRLSGLTHTFSDDFSTGESSISDDGRLLFVSTLGGIALFDLGPVLPVLTGLTPGRFPYDLEPPGGGPVVPVEVLVSGRFFTHGTGTTVAIGDRPAALLEVVDDRTLRVELPPGEPGPARVVVANSSGAVELERGFFYTPALSASASPGHLATEIQLDPDAAVFLLAALPPAVSTPLAPFGGRLCLHRPLVVLRLANWPNDTLPLDFTLAPDPALVGLEVLLQGLVGPRPLSALTFTNCASVVLQ